jgi:hypothetical protein
MSCSGGAGISFTGSHYPMQDERLKPKSTWETKGVPQPRSGLVAGEPAYPSQEATAPCKTNDLNRGNQRRSSAAPRSCRGGPGGSFTGSHYPMQAERLTPKNMSHQQTWCIPPPFRRPTGRREASPTSLLQEGIRTCLCHAMASNAQLRAKTQGKRAGQRTAA